MTSRAGSLVLSPGLGSWKVTFHSSVRGVTSVGRGWESELEKGSLCGLLPSLWGPWRDKVGRSQAPCLWERGRSHWQFFSVLGGYCYCPLTCASLGKNWLRTEVRHLPAPRDHPPQHLEPPAAEEEDLLRKAGSEDLALILVREPIPVCLSWTGNQFMYLQSAQVCSRWA